MSCLSIVKVIKYFTDMCWITVHEELSKVKIATEDICVMKIMQKHSGQSFINNMLDLWFNDESFMPIWNSMTMNYRIGHCTKQKIKVIEDVSWYYHEWKVSKGLHSIIGDSAEITFRWTCDPYNAYVKLHTTLGKSKNTNLLWISLHEITSHIYGYSSVDTNHEIMLVRCIIPKGTKYLVNEMNQVVSECLIPTNVIWRHTLYDIPYKPDDPIRFGKFYLE